MSPAAIDDNLAVLDLFHDSVRAIKVATDAYDTTRNFHNIPEGLKAVSGELKYVLQILEDAVSRWATGSSPAWFGLISRLIRCRKACIAMQALVVPACSLIDRGAERGKEYFDEEILEMEGERARGLLQEIWLALDMLARHEMVMDCHAVLAIMARVARVEGL
jgi:hypothetical protein